MRPPRDPDDIASLKKDGLIDPADTVAGKRQKRKERNRPEPPPELKDWKPSARKRADGRPFPPDSMLEPTGMDEEFWTAPHNDDELWRLQLADAFGTRSISVIWVFVEQLEHLCGKNIWDDAANQWRINEHEFSAALAIINSLKPRNELEAAHAAQMVAVHLLTMKVAARAIRYEYDTRTASMAGKLARTFTMQRETFERLRKPNRTSRQSIKVSRETHHHQHIHVHRGDQQNDGQPHGRQATLIDQRAALPGPHEEGYGVSLSSDEGQAGVPSSRGAKAQGRQAARVTAIGGMAGRAEKRSICAERPQPFSKFSADRHSLLPLLVTVPSVANVRDWVESFRSAFRGGKLRKQPLGRSARILATRALAV